MVNVDVSTQKKRDPLVRQRLVFCAVTCFVLALSAVLSLAHLPGPPCLFRLTLHIPCPGCGLTRSFKALCRADLMTSFRYHPLGLPLFALLTLYVVSVAASGPLPPLRKVRDRIEAATGQPVFWVVTTILLVGVWMVRMGIVWAGHRAFWW